jgi:DNA-directed RNA polymerase specialized sigma24 family protein
MTADEFDELLLWLDPDPERTGVPNRERGAEKYEKIRQRLIRVYRNRGSQHAEEIADVTFDRVGRKAKTLRPTYEGDPTLYVFGVAKNVYQEFLRKEHSKMATPPTGNDPEDVERRHTCLERCLKTLKAESRELILCFYEGEKREKIENRKRLAARLGINSKALSLRTLHIRQKLRGCIKDCLGE